MSSDLILAIDSGGTSVKVVAFAPDGQELIQRAADVRNVHHADGRVERDAEAFWSGTVSAIRSVLSTLPESRIIAVGITGFGNGIFLVDAQGKPTRPGIVSVDHRAQPVVDALTATGDAGRLSRLNGHRPWGGQTVMQLTHLERHEPQVVQRTRWALACKDFIRLRLTSEALTDPTDASGGGLMDLNNGTYSDLAFGLLGLDAITRCLPPIANSHEVAGRISAAAAAQTGIPEGTPVAGSMMDVAACALGAGSVDAKFLTMIAGTWSINTIETDPVAGDPAPILNMAYLRKGHRLLAEGSPCSAANFGWYLDQAMGGRLSMKEANALAADTELVTRRCHFIPTVFGPAPRRGSFVDLGASDDTGTMIRAIFEGVAFQHRRHAETAVALAGREMPQTIRLAGGASKSPIWAQVFADVCQRQVETVQTGEVGALGAAICASVAGGVHSDLAAAASVMSRKGASFAPNTGLGAFFDRRFEDFKIADAMLAGFRPFDGEVSTKTTEIQREENECT